MREVLGIITDILKKAGWSLGWVSAVDCEGREIWFVDANRGDKSRKETAKSDRHLAKYDEQLWLAPVKVLATQKP